MRQKSGVDGDGVVSFNVLLSYPFIHLLNHKTRLERILKEIRWVALFKHSETAVSFQT